MDLMGIPDSFQMIDAKKNMNAICQNVPVHTAADHIKWALGIIHNDPVFIGESVAGENIILQDNCRRNLEGEVFTLKDNHWENIKKLSPENCVEL
jgi:hypothetical protein